MRSPSTGFRALGLAFAMALGSGAARADFALTTPQAQGDTGTLVFSDPQTQVAPPKQTSFDAALSFQQFDPVLGTLRAVEVSFTGQLHADFEVIYGGAGVPIVTSKGSGQLTLNGPGSFSLTAPISISSGPVPISSGSISMSKDSSTTASGVLTDAPSLAAFTGTGTIDLNLIGGTFLTGYTVSNGNGQGKIVLADGGFATIRYQYLKPNGVPGDTGGGPGPVPEPTSIALLAIGVGALLSAGRLRHGPRRARKPEFCGERAA